ncbi:MAG: hypothetical protein GX028_07220 [Clostridiaceae bacterium]|nr:hypothetical protein [Clostridiaceae bacterium]
MELQTGNYKIRFISGGYEVFKDQELLYYNRRPMYAFVKTALSITEFYDAPYEEVAESANGLIAEGILRTPTGTELKFHDSFVIVSGGLRVDRKVSVIKTIDDLGFASKISFVLAPSDEISDYDYFAPGAWYRQNQFTAPHVVGNDTDCEYFWQSELKFGLPLFSAQHRASGEAISLSRWAADVVMRDTSIVASEHHVDRLINTGALGISKPEPKTLNYLYYGYPLRKQIETKRDGLMIDYVYPCTDGELPRKGIVYNIDYMMRTKTFSRVYHPMEIGFIQTYSVLVALGKYQNYYDMMLDAWRETYDRLRAPLFKVDNKQHYFNCMQLLTKATRKYGNAIGLPFACQLPDFDISSVSFQFGFVGQQPGIGYNLICYGDREGQQESSDKGRQIIDFWVKTAMTESGAPNVCYNPTIESFEPYPLWTRMIADGLEAILDAYVFTKKKNEDHPEWLEFCKQAANWLLTVQNDDGSFYRAYNQDNSMRMDSKANTTSVIRFLIQFYLVTRIEEYKAAALRAGTWCYENVYLNMEYRGSTCDNLDIIDNESGIYAMYAFQALYDLTSEDKWLEALKAAADFTETWTYSWDFPIRTMLPKHPFNTNGISGQSIITIGSGAGDVYMAAVSFNYYRLYLITGDEHYRDFAEFIHCNTRQSNDVDGSVGYIMTGLGHEAANFSNQTLQSHYHWLPWCTYVEIDPTARLEAAFGVYDIAEAELLPMQARIDSNRIYDHYADFSN